LATLPRANFAVKILSEKISLPKNADALAKSKAKASDERVEMGRRVCSLWQELYGAGVVWICRRSEIEIDGA